MGAVAVNDMLGIRGQLSIEICDAATGRVLRRLTTPNKVTQSGRNLAIDILRGAVSVLSKFAVGTGTAAAADGDTALVTEKVRDTITSMGQSANVLTVRYVLGTTQGNGFSMTEAGVMNDAGTLFARAVHAAISKTSAIVINYTWTFTLSSLT